MLESKKEPTANVSDASIVVDVNLSFKKSISKGLEEGTDRSFQVRCTGISYTIFYECSWLNLAKNVTLHIIYILICSVQACNDMKESDQSDVSYSQPLFILMVPWDG